MKIGFIKKRFNPFGGAENYLATVIARLLDDGHDIHLFCSEWKETEGVTLHRVRNLSFNSTASALSFNRYAAEAVGAVRPDCLFSFERTTNGDIYRAGDGCHREWLRIRKMVEGPLKAFSFSINPLHRALLHLEKQIFGNIRIIIANSTMVKDHILRHYEVPEERIHVIRNGVDTQRFSPSLREEKRLPIRNKYSLEDNVPIVLFVGSGYERKGLKTIIGAFRDVDRNAKLLVVGQGNIDKHRHIAESFGVSERMIFLGPQYDLESFYAASDLFVLPTLYDPFSNATIEAMASGLPVITTRNNGAAELLSEGREGFILDDMLSVEELAGKINLAFQSLPDMGANARLKAEQFTIDGATAEYLEVIKECIR